jgi:carboxypeptidase family protein
MDRRGTMTAMVRPRLSALTFALFLPGILSAQGRLRGVAFDSLLGRPLAGATVWLQDLNRSAFTDSAGRFVLDSVPPGRHVFLLAHPDLDSAGLGTVAAAITVARDQDVALAVPSLATFWRWLCGSESIGADSGIVFGSVRDMDSERLLAGAVVSVFWPKLQVTDSLQVRMDEETDSATTDSIGSYHVCGVGMNLATSVRARAGASFTGMVQVATVPRPLTRRDFAVSRLPAAGGQWRSVIHGRVETENGHPISRARVTVDGADSTVTDAQGVFLLPHLPGGTQWLRSRAVGFAPLERAVDLSSGDTTKLRIQLQSVTILDTITSVATRALPRALQEFEERRRAGFGYSLAAAEIKRASNVRSVMQRFPALIVGPRMSSEAVSVGGQVIQSTPDLREAQAPGTFAVYMKRDATLSGYCLANLYIDSIESAWEQLASYKPDELVGIEVYPRESLIPIRFQKVSSGCGAVLVWTKRVR